MDSASPHRIFTGAHDSDVEEFLYTYCTIIMRGKSDEEKAENLLAYIGGEVKQRYKAKYLTGYKLTDEGKNFDFVCQWLVEAYAKKVEPHEIIREAMDATIDHSNIVNSLNNVCSLYDKAGFNEVAKFGMLKKAMENATRIDDKFCQFILNKSPKTFDELKETISSFEKTKESFNYVFRTSKQINPNDFIPRPAMSASAIESVKEEMKTIEQRIDNSLEQVTSQLEGLTLTIKKTQNNSKDSIVCNYCGETGHYTTQCDKNPHKKTKCKNCGKWGHHENECRSKRVNFSSLNRVESESSSEKILLKPETNKNITTVALPVENNVSTTKRDHEGSIVNKKQRLLANEAPILPTLVRPSIQSTKKKNKRSQKTRANKNNSLQSTIGFQKPYEVLEELSSAPTGLTFGQLIRGDAEIARKTMKKVLNLGRSSISFTGATKTIPSRLKLVTVSLYNNEFQALIDSGAVPDLISKTVVDKIGLDLKPTEESIIVADGTSSKCIGQTAVVPLMFDKAKVKFKPLVMEVLPYDIIIGGPTLEKYSSKIDFGKQTITLKVDNQKIIIPLESEIRYAGKADNTDSEDFTSNDDSSSEFVEESSESDDELGPDDLPKNYWSSSEDENDSKQENEVLTVQKSSEKARSIVDYRNNDNPQSKAVDYDETKKNFNIENAYYHVPLRRPNILLFDINRSISEFYQTSSRMQGLNTTEETFPKYLCNNQVNTISVDHTPGDANGGESSESSIGSSVSGDEYTNNISEFEIDASQEIPEQEYSSGESLLKEHHHQTPKTKNLLNQSLKEKSSVREETMMTKTTRMVRWQKIAIQKIPKKIVQESQSKIQSTNQ